MAIKAKNEQRLEVFVNPYTAHVLGSRHWERSLTGFLYTLHYTLFAGKVGEVVVGICGLLLLLMAITGAILWTSWRKACIWLQNSPECSSSFGELRHSQTGRHCLEYIFADHCVYRGGARVIPQSARWLTKSGSFIQDFLLLGGNISRQMVLLEEDVRTGEIPNFHFDSQSPTCDRELLHHAQGQWTTDSAESAQVGKPRPSTGLCPTEPTEAPAR